MFFRREKAHEPTFIERLDNLKTFRYSIASAGAGKAVISRDGIAALVEDRPGQRPHVNKAGLSIRGEIAALVNGGYQMFWETASGQRAPALAAQLKRLHAFEEDLKEGLGLPSLYNESLGTTSDLHLYDRVEQRDRGPAPRPWDEKKVNA